MADMIRSCDSGAGVLCLFGNYGGDVMNFEMAREMADFDGIKTTAALGRDDVASSPKETAEKRRGVVGIVYAYKIAGAAAEKMMNLEEVTAIAQKALDNTRTMGIALSPCIVPEVGKPTFSIKDDEIEIGMGIHGEPGIEVTKMMSADEIAELMIAKIHADMPLKQGDEVSVLINGLGGTPLEEQFILYRKIHLLLKDLGVSVYMPHIGEFATSMEMMGLSASAIKLDSRLKELLRAPASPHSDTAVLAAAMEAGIASIMEKAKSKPGEKTVLDALCPGIEAVKHHSGAEAQTAWAEAAGAAAAGSESTRNMRSVHGRAAYYGDKSIGILDGGSVVGRLIFEGAAASLVD
jgi:dihydroxyacetone kinase